MTRTTEPRRRQIRATWGPPRSEAAGLGYGVHGRGQEPAYIAAVLERVGIDEVAWVLPGAPGNSWYPQSFLRPLEDNQPELDQALSRVREDLDEVYAAAEGRPVVLFGFSQGACLLAEYLLRDQRRPAVAVLHTGGYLGPSSHDWVDRGTLAGLPVLLATAEDDAWVPLSRVHETAQALSGLGATVTLDIYDDTEHHVNDNAVQRMRRFIRRALDPSATTA